MNARVTQQSRQAAYTGDPSARATQAIRQVIYSGSPRAIATQLFRQVAKSSIPKARASQIVMQAARASLPPNPRMTQMMRQIAYPSETSAGEVTFPGRLISWKIPLEAIDIGLFSGGGFNTSIAWDHRRSLIPINTLDYNGNPQWSCEAVVTNNSGADQDIHVVNASSGAICGTLTVPAGCQNKLIAGSFTPTPGFYVYLVRTPAVYYALVSVYAFRYLVKQTNWTRSLVQIPMINSSSPEVGPNPTIQQVDNVIAVQWAEGPYQCNLWKRDDSRFSGVMAYRFEAVVQPFHRNCGQVTACLFDYDTGRQVGASEIGYGDPDTGLVVNDSTANVVWTEFAADMPGFVDQHRYVVRYRCGNYWYFMGKVYAQRLYVRLRNSAFAECYYRVSKSGSDHGYQRVYIDPADFSGPQITHITSGYLATVSDTISTVSVVEEGSDSDGAYPVGDSIAESAIHYDSVNPTKTVLRSSTFSDFSLGYFTAREDTLQNPLVIQQLIAIYVQGIEPPSISPCVVIIPDCGPFSVRTCTDPSQVTVGECTPSIGYVCNDIAGSINPECGISGEREP